MRTLKDVWEEQQFTPSKLAGAAGTSTPTLYRMNYKEPVGGLITRRVCRVLGLSLEEYRALDAKPRAAEAVK